MAKLMQLQNGRTKMVRGRFGGDNTRLRDDWSTDRRQVMARILDADHRTEVGAVLTEHQPVDRNQPAGRFCPIAQQDVPTSGAIRTGEDGCDITLVYDDGRLRSAHCRGW